MRIRTMLRGGAAAVALLAGPALADNSLFIEQVGNTNIADGSQIDGNLNQTEIRQNANTSTAVGRVQEGGNNAVVILQGIAGTSVTNNFARVRFVDDEGNFGAAGDANNVFIDQTVLDGQVVDVEIAALNNPDNGLFNGGNQLALIQQGTTGGAPNVVFGGDSGSGDGDGDYSISAGAAAGNAVTPDSLVESFDGGAPEVFQLIDGPARIAGAGNLVAVEQDNVGEAGTSNALAFDVEGSNNRILGDGGGRALPQTLDPNTTWAMNGAGDITDPDTSAIDFNEVEGTEIAGYGLQSGNGNISVIGITGDDNFVALRQTGDDNISEVVQTGDANVAFAVQTAL